MNAATMMGTQPQRPVWLRLVRARPSSFWIQDSRVLTNTATEICSQSDTCGEHVRAGEWLDFRTRRSYAGNVRIAFKEWVVVVDALGRGEQILVLRKGGLLDGGNGFRLEHSSFLLFPTMFHQQRDSVMPSARERFDFLAAHQSDENQIRFEFCAVVVCSERLDNPNFIQRLHGQHIWRDELIAQRFDWGAEAGVEALAVRVYQLPTPIEVPMSPAYRGCKSWVELETDISTDQSRPVLSDEAFDLKLKQFHSALESAPASA